MSKVEGGVQLTPPSRLCVAIFSRRLLELIVIFLQPSYERLSPPASPHLKLFLYCSYSALEKKNISNIEKREEETKLD